MSHTILFLDKLSTTIEITNYRRILKMIKRIFSESDQNYGKKKIKGENVKCLIQLNKNCFCSTTCRSSSESTFDVSLVNNKYLHFI